MNNLQQQETFSLLPKNFAEAEKLAKYMADSDLVPKEYQKKPANVLIAVQMGFEVGLQPMQAIQNIAVINNRPCIWGDAMLAICLASPICDEIEETFNEEKMTATCKAKRKNMKTYHIATFSQKDAERANLWNKSGPWKQYPERMLRLRARGFALRNTFADALKGLHSAEEVRDYPQQPIKNMGSVETITNNKVKEKPIHATDSVEQTNGVVIVDPPGVITKTKPAVTIDDIKKAMAKHVFNMDKFYDHYEISRVEELEGKFDLSKILAQITSKPLRESEVTFVGEL